MCSCGNEEGCIGFEVGCRCVCHHSEALSLIDKLHLQVSKEEQMKFAARDATIAVQKKLDETLLQKSEVTAHRDRLRNMMNDVRGLLLCPPADLEVQIMRRIEDSAITEKR